MKLLLTALSGKFELWPQIVAANAQQADVCLFRIDGRHADVAAIVPLLPYGSHYFVSDINEPDEERAKWIWREELLMAAHRQLQEHFSWVLFPDEDELLPDLSSLPGWQNNEPQFGQYMFNYQMASAGHPVIQYPTLPHAKVFAYKRQLTYRPYFHQARVGYQGKKLPELTTDLLITHYCFYQKNWFDAKMASILDRYPNYFEHFPKQWAKQVVRELP